MLGWPNLVDTSDVRGGGWRASAPVSNVKDSDLGVMARTVNTNPNNTKLVIALPTSKAARMLVALRPNVTLEAGYRVRAADAEVGGTELYNSGWLAGYPPMYDTLALEWSDANWWGGRMVQEQRGIYPAQLLHVLPEPITAPFWFLDIDDQANPDGYIELARVVLANQFQPTWNFSWGCQEYIKSQSSSEKSLGGQAFFDKRIGQRCIRLSLDYLSYAEAYGRLYDMDRTADIHGEIYVLPDIDDTINLHRRSFYGRMPTLTQLDRYMVKTIKKSLEFEEVM